MNGWNEDLHPRDNKGEFTHGTDWADRLSTQIGVGLGFGSTGDVQRALQGIGLPAGISVDEDRTFVRGDKLEVTLKDRDGNTAGSFTWSLKSGRNGEHVRYSFARVPDKHQKKGIAKAVSNAIEQHLRDRGVGEIRLAANSGGANSGGVVWAKAGYDWDPDSTTSGSVASLIYEMEDMADEEGDAELADKLHAWYIKVQKSRKDPSSWPTPKELVNLKAKNGKKIGEIAFSQFSFAGRKRL